jgi:hypothetical protein
MPDESKIQLDEFNVFIKPGRITLIKKVRLRGHVDTQLVQEARYGACTATTWTYDHYHLVVFGAGALLEPPETACLFLNLRRVLPAYAALILGLSPGQRIVPIRTFMWK